MTPPEPPADEPIKCAECRGRGFLFSDNPMRRLPCLACRCTGFVAQDLDAWASAYHAVTDDYRFGSTTMP